MKDGKTTCKRVISAQTGEIYLFCTRLPLLSNYNTMSAYEIDMDIAGLTSVSLSTAGVASFLGLRPGFGLAGMTHSLDAMCQEVY